MRSLVGAGRSQRVPGGPRNRCVRLPRQPLQCGGRRRSSAEGLELYGRLLAYTWRFDAVCGEGLAAGLHLARLGGSRRIVDRGGCGGLTQVEPRFPAFDEDRLYWVRPCDGEPQGCVRRTGLRRQLIRGGETEGVASPRFVLGHDVDRATTYIVTRPCDPVERPRCTVSASQPPYEALARR